MPLDLNQPYGTIIGDDEGRCFEQDGVFYGPGGTDMDAPKGRKAKQAPADPAADPAVDAQLAAQLGDA